METNTSKLRLFIVISVLWLIVTILSVSANAGYYWGFEDYAIPIVAFTSPVWLFWSCVWVWPSKYEYIFNLTKNNEKKKINTKAAATTAVRWAFILSAGFIVAPIVVNFANMGSVPGEMIAEKLVVGVIWFVIIFISLFIWGMLFNKEPITGSPVTTSNDDNIKSTVGFTTSSLNTKPSKWNYIGVVAGVLMLSSVFLPRFLDGTIEGKYYIGVAFWVCIIIYGVFNIYNTNR